MNGRFFVREIFICTFDRIQPGKVKPNLSDYPTRLCVVDEEKEIAIDIKTRLKYDYVKTTSYLYFLSQSYKKIEDGKRVAVFPLIVMDESLVDLYEVFDIIQKLKTDYEFKDGNEVYGNEQYLEYIRQEKEIEDEQKEISHTKKIGKRKK